MSRAWSSCRRLTSDSVRSIRLLFSSVRFSLDLFSSSPSPSSLKTLTSSVLPRSSPPLPDETCGIVNLYSLHTLLRHISHHDNNRKQSPLTYFIPFPASLLRGSTHRATSYRKKHTPPNATTTIHRRLSGPRARHPPIYMSQEQHKHSPTTAEQPCFARAKCLPNQWPVCRLPVRCGRNSAITRPTLLLYCGTVCVQALRAAAVGAVAAARPITVRFDRAEAARSNGSRHDCARKHTSPPPRHRLVADLAARPPRRYVLDADQRPATGDRRPATNYQHQRPPTTTMS